MKNLLLFALLFVSASVFSQVGIQTNSGSSNLSGSDGSSTDAIFTCCMRVYLKVPPSMPGGRATMKLIKEKPFGGAHEGIDLSNDFLDPSGNVVSDDAGAISKSDVGDLIIDGAKLRKGMKYRLRLRAGQATETYDIQ